MPVVAAVAAFATSAGVTAAGVAAAATVVGTAGSLYFGAKAASAQRSAARSEQAQSDLQAARVRRDAIRQSRIQSANAEQTASNQSVSDSSGAIGGQGSIFSQMMGNLSFLDQSKSYADQASHALGQAQTYNNYANIAGTVAKAGEWAHANPSFFDGLKGKTAGDPGGNYG